MMLANAVVRLVSVAGTSVDGVECELGITSRVPFTDVMEQVAE